MAEPTFTAQQILDAIPAGYDTTFTNGNTIVIHNNGAGVGIFDTSVQQIESTEYTVRITTTKGVLTLSKKTKHIHITLF